MGVLVFKLAKRDAGGKQPLQSAQGTVSLEKQREAIVKVEVFIIILLGQTLILAGLYYNSDSSKSRSPLSK